MDRPDLRLVSTPVLTAPVAADAADAERMVTMAYIRHDLGGVTQMTIWRWSKDPDPEIRFPAPDLWISNRKRLWFLWKYRAWKARIIARGRINSPRTGHAEAAVPADAGTPPPAA